MKKYKQMIALFLVMLLALTLILPASAADSTDVFKNISYYGNLSACKMTQQQAEAFAAVIRSEEENRRQYAEECMEEDGYFDYVFDNQVAFVDTGNGIPAMLFFSSMNRKESDGSSYSCDFGYNSLWQWTDGKVEQFFTPTDWLEQYHGYSGKLYCYVYPEYILFFKDVDSIYAKDRQYAVFPFQNGQIACNPSTTAYLKEYYPAYIDIVVDGANNDFEIDGKTVSESEMNAWMDRHEIGTTHWGTTEKNELAGVLAGYYYDGWLGAYFVKGMSPAKKVLSALDTYAGQASGQCGDDLTWHVDLSTGVLTIRGTGDMWYYPEAGYDWPECGAPWAVFNQLVTKIVIGEGVTTISDGAFCGFDQNKEVSLPSTLVTIGNDAFWLNTAMKQVTIPPSVLHIGNWAFGLDYFCEGGVAPVKGYTIRGYHGTETERYYNELLEDYTWFNDWWMESLTDPENDPYADNFGPDGTVYFVDLGEPPEGSARNVDINDIPQKEELTELLDWLDFHLQLPECKDSDCEYNYLEVTSKPYNIYELFLREPEIFSPSLWDLYPGRPSQYFSWDNVITYKDKINWIMLNIMNCNQNDLETLKADCLRKNMVYDEGDHYRATMMVDGFEPPTVDQLLSASYDGKYYYVTYSTTRAGDVWYYYATLGLKTIDGKTYWTIYANDPNRFISFSSAPEGILGQITAQSSNGQWNVTVPLQNLEQNATVICGLYNGDGKMLDVSVKNVMSGSEGVSLTLDKMNGGKIVRAFLLSAEFAPLDKCVETDLPAS